MPKESKNYKKTSSKKVCFFGKIVGIDVCLK